MSAFITGRVGIEKSYAEPSRMRRLAYQLIGEVHIPGRIRLYHVIRAIDALKLPSSGVRMLDAGTGRGDLALRFARLNPGWKVEGIDVEDEKIDKCIEARRALGLANTTFKRGDLLELDASERYDLITNCDVLEHVADDARLVANFARALRSGGYLILTFPSIPQRRHLRTVAWRERRIGFSPEDIGHVRPGYSVAGAAELLSKAGLEPVVTRQTYGYFGTLAHDLFFTIGDSQVNPVIYTAALPALLMLSFLELHTPTRHGSGLLVIARKP